MRPEPDMPVMTTTSGTRLRLSAARICWLVMGMGPSFPLFFLLEYSCPAHLGPTCYFSLSDLAVQNSMLKWTAKSDRLKKLPNQTG